MTEPGTALTIAGVKDTLRPFFPAAIAIWGAVLVFAAFTVAGERGPLSLAALFIPRAHW